MVEMKDVDKELNKLESVIKAKKAVKAIRHVINRVEQFNNQYFPLEIKLIGIGGSSIRVEEPKDIDIFVEAHGIQEIWKEFFEFKQKLGSNINYFAEILFEIGEIKERVTIDDLIEVAKDDLLRLGFKKIWIENWLPWVRISDIRWGLDRGLPIVSFDEENLLSRFIKTGWRGKKARNT